MKKVQKERKPKARPLPGSSSSDNRKLMAQEDSMNDENAWKTQVATLQSMIESLHLQIDETQENSALQLSSLEGEMESSKAAAYAIGMQQGMQTTRAEWKEVALTFTAMVADKVEEDWAPQPGMSAELYEDLVLLCKAVANKSAASSEQRSDLSVNEGSMQEENRQLQKSLLEMQETLTLLQEEQRNDAMKEESSTSAENETTNQLRASLLALETEKQNMLENSELEKKALQDEIASLELQVASSDASTPVASSPSPDNANVEETRLWKGRAVKLKKAKEALDAKLQNVEQEKELLHTEHASALLSSKDVAFEEGRASMQTELSRLKEQQEIEITEAVTQALRNVEMERPVETKVNNPTDTIPVSAVVGVPAATDAPPARTGEEDDWGEWE